MDILIDMVLVSLSLARKKIYEKNSNKLVIMGEKQIMSSSMQINYNSFKFGIHYIKKK
jgi:hypothetical protein